jgi:hypothetical protein
MAISESVRKECRRLRREERLGLAEIARRIGIAKSSASLILKDMPLTEAEKAGRLKLAREAAAKTNKKSLGAPSKFQMAVAEVTLSGLEKAKIAEAAVLFRLCLHGFVVYGSPFDGDSADWIVQSKGGNTYRVQVKWAKQTDQGLPLVRLFCMRRGKKVRYGNEDFDFIVGYCLFNDTAYVWSEKEIREHTSTVTISEDAAEAWGKLL